MTLDGFRRYIKDEMEKGVPFLAYWYDGGTGLLRTGPIERPPLIMWALYKHNRKTPILYDSEDACQQANRLSWMAGVPARYEMKEIPPEAHSGEARHDQGIPPEDGRAGEGAPGACPRGGGRNSVHSDRRI